MPDDDLNMRATLDESVSSALARMEERLESLERELAEVNVAGRAAGEGVESGAEQGEEALRREETQARKTKESVKGLGDETDRSSKKTDAAVSRWARYEKQLAKTSKTFGGFSWLQRTMKWAVMAAGVFTLAGAVGALGAAAGMALGQVMMAAPGFAALGPIGLAAALGMKAAKLGLEELQPLTDSITKKFDGLGKAVARGGFADGLSFLEQHMGGFVRVTEEGFGKIGGSLGIGATALGAFLSEDRRLAQFGQIFTTVNNIIRTLIPGLFQAGGGVLTLFTATLGPGERLAKVINDLLGKFGAWAERVTASGKATEVINNGLTKLINAGRIVWNFLAGFINILRIAAGQSSGLGLSLDQTAQKFRAWTGSAEGQTKITKYFQDMLPAIREGGLLIRDLIKGMSGFATGGNLAPLIAQIRTELLPVILELMNKMSGSGGLMSSVVSIATSIGTILTAIDPSTFQIIADAIAGLAAGISWLTENVPGASSALSTLFTVGLLAGPVAALGEKAMGIIDTVTGIGGAAATAYEKLGEYKGYWDEFAGASEEIQGMKDQIMGAVDWTKGLVAEGGLLHAPWTWASAKATAFGTILKTHVASGMLWVRTTAATMWTAIMGPIGLVILAIMAVVAIVWYLWENCEWFRDAVTAVWEWIKNAAVVAWEWIKNAVMIAIQVISTIVMWLWTNVIQPVWQIIATAAEMYWNVIVFVVQVVVFIIVGIVTLLAVILQGIWWLISTAAVAVWEYVILPIIQFVAMIAIAVWTAVSTFFTWLWGIISTAALAAWNGVILPVIQFVAGIVMAVWNAVATFFTWLWGLVSSGASSAWNGVILPILQGAAAIAMAVWTPVRDFLVSMWKIIQTAASACWDGIKSAATTVANVVKGVWNAVVGVVRGAWNGIAGAWNSIPSITVPDWVPGIGGSTFGLPKMPTLWHGGKIEFDSAIVGELGPEPLLSSSGRYMGMLGANGPEIASGLPRGGYVVPNLDTLTSMPGLMRKLPAGVGSAVAGSVPGYAELFSSRDSAPPPPPPAPRDDSGDNRELVGAVRALANAVADRPPPITASGPDVETQVYRALRKHEQQREISKRYSYGG